MTVEIISRSISTKVWDLTGIELMTPGSAVVLSTDYATWPDVIYFHEGFKIK